MHHLNDHIWTHLYPDTKMTVFLAKAMVAIVEKYRSIAVRVPEYYPHVFSSKLLQCQHIRRTIPLKIKQPKNSKKREKQRSTDILGITVPFLIL